MQILYAGLVLMLVAPAIGNAIENHRERREAHARRLGQ